MFDVVVIGCGAIGLTTALEIQRKLDGKATVTIFAEEVSPRTTSDVAAGLWQPYLLQDNAEDDVIRWSKVTYDYLLTLWKRGEAKQLGICLQPAVNLFGDENIPIPKWVSISIGSSTLRKRDLERFSRQYGQTFRSGFEYVTFTWEASTFLPFLLRRFTKKGGRLVRKRVDSFDELSKFDVIVNCAGLNAKYLTADDKVVPIRGQIVNVEAPWQNIIYIVQLDDNSSCYVIPNTNSVILGGTKQASYDTRVDERDTDKILKNTSKLIPPLEGCKVVKQQVGLRPGRNKVRLQEELLRRPDGKILKVVHNYGHGGAGITLCVGCAQDAAALVENLLSIGYNKL